MAHEPPLVLDRYAVYAPLASGGMATVHLGRLIGPVGFARTVAIKRMRADLLADSDSKAMFVDEARVAGRVRHPNVVAVNDVVETDRELLLVMEYVPGETLARLMQLAERCGGIPAPIGAAIVRDTLAGLHAAHETTDEAGAPLGIVHRDVSPQNIIVGVDGVARVLDFGVAKAIGRSQVTREGELKGKLAYMSPEQLQGRATRASDVFAASIIFWEVLCHARLFRGETDAETVGKVLTLDAEPPSKRNADLGDRYDAVALRGLARNPDERFETARDMALAITTAGPIADAARVGEWVAEIARERLAARAKLVSDVEQGIAVGFVDRGPVSRPSSSLPSLALTTSGRFAVDALDTRVDLTPTFRRAPHATWAKISTVAAIVAVAALVVALVALRSLRSEARPTVAIAPPPAAAREPAPPAPTASAPIASVAESAAPPVIARRAPPRPVAPPPPAAVRVTPAIPDHL